MPTGYREQARALIESAEQTGKTEQTVTVEKTGALTAGSLKMVNESVNDRRAARGLLNLTY